MELEKLTKAQIVLLTLLVSFVTSIATGIVTVTLMDQAPPGVSHTINRVVERTVERVVPQKNNQANVSQTVVVEADEKIANAVATNEQSVVRIYALQKQTAATSTDTTTEEKQSVPTEVFVSLGFIASQEGLVVTDSASVSNEGAYKIKLPDGSMFDADVVRQNESHGVALLELSIPEDVDITLTSVTFGDAQNLSLGQKGLALIGEYDIALIEGLVSSFEVRERTIKAREEGEEDVKETYRSAVYTGMEMKPSGSGSLLFTMKGDIVGMNIVRESETKAVTAEVITNIITAMHESDEADVEENTDGGSE